MNIGIIYLLIAFILLILSVVKSPEKTKQALKAAGKISLTVFPVLFLIFILMGVTSVFVSKETIGSWLGSGSGVLGIVIWGVSWFFCPCSTGSRFSLCRYTPRKGGELWLFIWLCDDSNFNRDNYVTS